MNIARRKDGAVVAVVAAVTATLVWGIFGPDRAGAKDDEAKPKPRAVQALWEDGMVMTLQTVKPDYKPGEQPIVRLLAVNSGDEKSSIETHITMMAESPMARVSRIVLPRKPIWTGTCAVEVGPKGIASYDIPTETAIPKGMSISFVLKAKGKQAYFMRLGGATLANLATLGSPKLLQPAKAKAQSTK